MLNPLRVLPHKQTIRLDRTLTDTRSIEAMHHLAVMVFLGALAEGISKLITPAARQNIDSWLLVNAVTCRISLMN